VNISKSKMSEEGRMRYDWIKDWKVGDLLTNEGGDTLLLTAINLDPQERCPPTGYQGYPSRVYYPDSRSGSRYASVKVSNLKEGGKQYGFYISYTMKDWAGEWLARGETREGRPALPFWQMGDAAAVKGKLEALTERRLNRRKAERDFNGLIHDWLGPWEAAVRKNPYDLMAYLEALTEVNGLPVSDLCLNRWTVRPHTTDWELSVRVAYRLDGQKALGSNGDLYEFETSADWQPRGTQ